MSKERLYLFDTTLRDGQQTQGVQFSTTEKLQIAQALDALGVDHIEGGWPGANPTDSAFFDEAPKTRATMTAFGMTKRKGISAENDDVLAAVINANTPAALPTSRHRGAKRSLTPNTSLTATRPTQNTRWRPSKPPMTMAHAGSGCVTPMAAHCPQMWAGSRLR
jgi:hypothetical protein